MHVSLLSFFFLIFVSVGSGLRVAGLAVRRGMKAVNDCRCASEANRRFVEGKKEAENPPPVYRRRSD